MGSKLDKTLERIRADRTLELEKNPPPDTESIFINAQREAAIERLFTPPRPTPEAAATPPVVIGTQTVEVRNDLTRLIQPVVIRGH